MQFQSYIYGKNHWHLEPDLRAILARYWPTFQEHRNEFDDFGALVGSQVYELGDYVDHHAPPELVMHDMEGKRVDRARLVPAHLDLLKRLAKINRPPYEGGSWHHHFALAFLLADPGFYCPLIVTNQTAYALHKYAPEHAETIQKLLSGESWGATWMTETQGGSDLGANTTIATKSDHCWLLNGENKYFASNAGLADYALVTARPEGAQPGPKGLALFLLPRELSNGDLNFHVRRFKHKIGTRAVPTGEVECLDSQATLIGEASQGIYYTLETLTVSRFANAIGAMGVARKAHLEALYRVQARQAFNQQLVEHPLVRRDLTDIAVRTAAGLCLVFHAIELFDRAWLEAPPYSPAYHYARFFSHLAKNRTADHAIKVTLLAMELFGGLGFLEEYAIARWHREALVTPIWEGTSNIQALDMLEVMQKKAAHESFLDEFIPMLERVGTPEAKAARDSLEQILEDIVQRKPQEVQWYGKDYLKGFADIAQTALLYSLAENSSEHYVRLADLYARRFIFGEPYPGWAIDDPTMWFPVELQN
jgi:alkylation response protein AidB-like acyl-CoA dehydrogenase